MKELQCVKVISRDWELPRYTIRVITLVSKKTVYANPKKNISSAHWMYKYKLNWLNHKANGFSCKCKENNSFKKSYKKIFLTERVNNMEWFQSWLFYRRRETPVIPKKNQHQFLFISFYELRKTNVIWHYV